MGGESYGDYHAAPVEPESAEWNVRQDNDNGIIIKMFQLFVEWMFYRMRSTVQVQMWIN